MKKIFIYDFDGTLTPYPMPRYEIINKCNVSFDEMTTLNINYAKNNNTNRYIAYYKVLFSLMEENDYDINIENICIGSDNIKLNPGVIEFLKKHNNIKHYIVTSGLKDYINNNEISKYLSDIYGATIDYSNKEISKIITDKDKVLVIKEIIKQNNCKPRDIVYFGDGLTDKYAFDYIHNNGGKCVLIKTNTNEDITDNIDIKCNVNYNIGKDIDNYISKIKEE